MIICDTPNNISWHSFVFRELGWEPLAYKFKISFEEIIGCISLDVNDCRENFCLKRSGRSGLNLKSVPP